LYLLTFSNASFSLTHLDRPPLGGAATCLVELCMSRNLWLSGDCGHATGPRQSAVNRLAAGGVEVRGVFGAHFTCRGTRQAAGILGQPRRADTSSFPSPPMRGGWPCLLDPSMARCQLHADGPAFTIFAILRGFHRSRRQDKCVVIRRLLKNVQWRHAPAFLGVPLLSRDGLTNRSRGPRSSNCKSLSGPLVRATSVFWIYSARWNDTQSHSFQSSCDRRWPERLR
jgi:hypothetical protein